jgi:type IV secretory pathway VirB2 component (pilin)
MVNDSFPFLWPLVIAPIIGLLGPAAPAGAFLFVAIWLLSAAVGSQIFKILELPKWVSAGFGLLLLAIPGYLDEGAAGRSIPLSTLFLLVSVRLILKLRYKYSKGNLLAIGLCLSACAGTRFDAILFGPIIIISLQKYRIFNVKRSLLALCSWLAFPMIWSIYSINRFQTLYVSDNRSVLLSGTPKYVTDWQRISDESQISLPALLDKIFNNTPTLIKVSVYSYRYFLILLLFTAVAFFFTYRISLKTSQSTDEIWQTSFSNSMITSTVCIGFVQTGLMLLTGYFDFRYWINFTVLLVITLVSAMKYKTNRMLRIRRGKTENGKLFFGVLFLVAILMVSQTVIQHYKIIENTTKYDKSLIHCIQKEEKPSIIPGIQGFRIPATTEFKAATPPGNFKELAAADWLNISKTYGINSWVVQPGVTDGDIPEAAIGIIEAIECGKNKK